MWSKAIGLRSKSDRGRSLPLPRGTQPGKDSKDADLSAKR
jgi:hypothetical protein